MLASRTSVSIQSEAERPAEEVGKRLGALCVDWTFIVNNAEIMLSIECVRDVDILQRYFVESGRPTPIDEGRGGDECTPVVRR